MTEQLRKLLEWTAGLSYPARLLGMTSLVAFATLIQWLLRSVIPHHPYFLFFVVVAICALLFERITAFFALVLGGLVAFVFFRPSRPSLVLPAEELITPVVFMIASLVVLLVVERFRRLADALNEADHEKAMLLKELHHRTKNNLHTIGATISLEIARAKHEETKASLERVARRIAGVAHITEALRQFDQDGQFNARKFFEELVSEISSSLADGERVAIACHADDVPIDRKSAELLGIIVNELITNAVKYAFPNGRKGTVTVEFGRAVKGALWLTVYDDGVGCGSDVKKGTGLGLVSALAKLGGGGAEIEDASPGCRVIVRILPP